MNWRWIAWQNPRDLFADSFDYVADSEESPRLAFLERFDDLHRHRHTEIGSDKRFLQLIPVDRFPGELFRE
jgi:hypothetical protein